MDYKLLSSFLIILLMKECFLSHMMMLDISKRPYRCYVATTVIIISDVVRWSRISYSIIGWGTCLTEDVDIVMVFVLTSIRTLNMHVRVKFSLCTIVSLECHVLRESVLLLKVLLGVHMEGMHLILDFHWWGGCIGKSSATYRPGHRSFVTHFINVGLI